MKDDIYFLRKAAEEGNKVAAPYNFGALVVKGGKIIAAEHPHVADLHDPSAHDSITALRAAGQKLGTDQLVGCTLYCSHEPCMMCFSCAAWACIDRVVYASPKSEAQISYEYKDIDLQEMSKKLLRPMKVEQIRL